MNQNLKNKLSVLLSSTLSFVTVMAICAVAALIMDKKYYSTIFVSGGSMNPTLVGGHDDSAHAPYITVSGEYVKGDTVNFGKVDSSKKAKSNIKRYDIVTTYFPDDYDSNGKLNESADYKIKRVIALPGETFKIEQGNLYIKENDEFTFIERKHQINDSGNVSIKDVKERTLGKDEYWVMGDHRSGSRDCVTFNAPVTFNQITGVLVSVEGVAEYYVHYNCHKCGKEINEKRYLSGEQRTCPSCGGNVGKGSSDIRNRKYTYPDII